jgi:hypothetical protein
MSVNSANKGQQGLRRFLNNLTRVVMLALLFIASSFARHPDHDLPVKQLNLMIRQLGHHLLLQAGDSTSRVLPVTETKEGTFVLSFEKELSFSHDSLMTLSRSLLPKTQFPSGYTVTVHDCLKTDIVYGFQFNNNSPDIVACQGRSEPRGCYTLELMFPDLHRNVETNVEIKAKKPATKKKAEVAPSSVESKSTQIDPHLKPGEFNAVAIQRESPVTSTHARSYPLIKLLVGGMLVLLSVTLLIGRLRKRTKSTPPKDHLILKEPGPAFTSLGKFLFDEKDRRLLFGDEAIDLTDKEFRILELLHKNFGELVSRETLMQKIWIDEGVITGRSLDMFVSKLRKKLSHDPHLRITNVHGKGYKLETTVA